MHKNWFKEGRTDVTNNHSPVNLPDMKLNNKNNEHRPREKNNRGENESSNLCYPVNLPDMKSKTVKTKTVPVQRGENES